MVVGEGRPLAYRNPVTVDCFWGLLAVSFAPRAGSRQVVEGFTFWAELGTSLWDTGWWRDGTKS